MEKYRDWEILDTLPEGWIVDNSAGSPVPRTVFITNGKSVLNGQKRALLKIKPEHPVTETVKTVDIPKVAPKEDKEPDYTFPAKSVNTLARKKFQEQLLKEIHFDLMVCEIEGWDKKEYIKELKKLINSIDLTNKKTNKTQQPTLF